MKSTLGGFAPQNNHARVEPQVALLHSGDCVSMDHERRVTIYRRLGSGRPRVHQTQFARQDRNKGRCNAIFGEIMDQRDERRALEQWREFGRKRGWDETRSEDDKGASGSTWRSR